jgi:outer membrane protein assembly factor BamD
MTTFFKKRIIPIFIVLAVAGCAKEKSKEDMQFDELTKKAFAAIDKKNNEKAIDYLQEVVARFPDKQNIATYKMLLAELLFKDKQYPAAQELYEHFNNYYPGDKQAEYAKYRSITSKFNQTLRADCDQTDTEDTLKLCDEYLENKSFQKYKKEIIDIHTTCENRLVDKEIYVFDFYIHEGKYDAARNRLKHLKETYLVKNELLEPRILFLECKLAKKEKDHATVKKMLDTLTNKFPESQFTRMAQSMNTQLPFIF